jgi:hypothetical protein
LSEAEVLINLFSESECSTLETSAENLCVYGLGECPVLTIMGDKMKAMEQRSKVLPQDPGAAAVSQMIQPLLQMNANIYAMLPSFCPNCPKRIVAIEKELNQLRKPAK